MNTLSPLPNPESAAIEAILLYGDLSRLTPEQRGQYVSKLCEIMGLNPLTKPFEFMILQGKMVCYAGKNCAEQLRKIHNVSLRVTAREKIDDVYVVTVDASLPNGRSDSSTGAVPLSGLRGDALANAMMKAETKAKRRATLSICSLGMLDETEVDTIPKQSAVFPSQPEAGDGQKPLIPASITPKGKITGSYAGRKIHEISESDLRKAVEEMYDLSGLTIKQEQWLSQANEYLTTLDQQEPDQAIESRPKPQCCNVPLVLSKNGNSYYCPKFPKDSSKDHMRISKEEYESA